MKKGISIWSFPKDWDLEKCFFEAKKAGFDGIELALGSNGVPEDISEDGLNNIRDMAKRSGMELYSIACAMFFENSLTADELETWKLAEGYIKRELDIAAYLGCDTVLVIPGIVRVPWNPDLKPMPYDTVYQRASERLKGLVAYAEEKNVVIGLENVWNMFLLSPLEMRDFIDSFKSEYIASYFDVGNVLLTGYPEHWIKILNKRVKKVHIKDFSIAVGNLNGFVDLLKGDVNFPAVMKALKETGYNGWITAEVGIRSLAEISSEMDTILTGYR